MDLTVVVVNWNVAPLVVRCLRSVFDEIARTRLATRVIVVDNASTDDSVTRITAEFPNARLIRNETNRGFVQANNQALRVAEGRYALLLNPDTELMPGALDELVRFADAHPDVGVVGPLLRYPDGSVQSSRRRFPTLATAFVESTPVQWWFPKLSLLKRYYVADRPDDQPQDVDWVVGACMLVRRDALARVGMFDERFFMYSEELDLCQRIKAAGWRVVFWPAAVVVHHEGKSSEQNLARRSILFNESKCRYVGKYYGRGWETALRGYLLLMTLLQWIEEAVKLVLGHKRELRQTRLKMLGEVARWQARSVFKSE